LTRFAGGALLLVLLAGGCGSEPTGDQAAPQQTAQRIVTLAPHLAELVFAAGAGEQLVGVSAYSDYPPAVNDVPVIGDAFAVDLERLRLLEPDLVIAWRSGMPASQVDNLENAGFNVVTVETVGLDDVGPAVRRIGALTGHAAEAESVAAAFTAAIDELAQRHADREPLRVFYQISARPLYTFNGDHYISDLIELCGGRNVFEDIAELAPAVDVEAVIERDPEVILAPSGTSTEPFEAWDRWPHIAANRYGARYTLPADEVARATPRLVVGGRAICAALEAARERRSAAASGAVTRVFETASGSRPVRPGSRPCAARALPRRFRPVP